MRAATPAIALLLLALSAPRPGSATIFTVDDTGDLSDPCPTDGACHVSGLCGLGTGPCTLRAAIDSVNGSGTATALNPDVIQFAIGTGQQTIQPTSSYSIGQPVIIDGTTQPGFVSCEYPTGGPLIEIDGSLAPAGDGAFAVLGGNSTIKGLVINRFTCLSGSGTCTGGTGIVLKSDDNKVQCNYIGTDVTGTLLGFGNGGGGVGISLADGNLVGGPAAGDRNVVSNNGDPGGPSPTAGISINDNDPTLMTGNTILGNYIGTDVTGTYARGNGTHGVIVIQSVNNQITGNLASANAGSGVYVVGSNTPGVASFNTIAGNTIGTDATGTQKIDPASVPLGNAIHGVRIFRADHNTVSGNLISGNLTDGVHLERGGENDVFGCRIGTAANGVDPLGNDRHGVAIGGAGGTGNDNTIGGSIGVTAGGPCTGTCNVIAYNAAAGVFVDPESGSGGAVGNLIQGNSIFENGPNLQGLGIDLLDSLPGVNTPNDPWDADTGGNGMQNFPVLTSVVDTGGAITVTGTLDSTPNGMFRIDVFANASCDPANYGEGATWLGATTVPTSGAGSATISVPLAYSSTMPFPGGSLITATATDLATNDTSEFSPCEPVVPPGTTTSTTEPGTTTTSTTVPDPFSCHKIRRLSPSLYPLGGPLLTFDDRFATHVADVYNKPYQLCAPADVGTGDHTEPSHPLHLEVYKLRGTPQNLWPNVLVTLTDAFGPPFSAWVRRPDFVATPTYKTLASPAPSTPPLNPLLDDFFCYRLQVLPNVSYTNVLAVDQFGSVTTNLQPKWLCTPVDVNGANPSVPTHLDQLTCYKAVPTPPLSVPAWTHPGFGPESLQVKKVRMVCVPSRIQ